MAACRDLLSYGWNENFPYKKPFIWEQVAAPVRAQAAADSAASHLPSSQELYDWGLHIIRQDTLNSLWLQAARKVELAIISF